MGFEVIRKKRAGPKRQARARIMFAGSERRLVFITLTGTLVEQAGLSNNVEVLAGSGPDYGHLWIRQTDSPLGHSLIMAGSRDRNHRRVSVKSLRQMFVGDTPFVLDHEIRPDGLYLRIPPDRLKQPMREAAE